MRCLMRSPKRRPGLGKGDSENGVVLNKRDLRSSMRRSAVVRNMLMMPLSWWHQWILKGSILIFSLIPWRSECAEAGSSPFILAQRRPG